jgi:predicted nucleotidyltransferase
VTAAVCPRRCYLFRVYVSPEEAVRHLNERLSHRPSEDMEAEAAARGVVPALVSALQEAGAQRVVLFGSLARGSFRKNSDIDLAVSGLPERALAKLEHELTLVAHRPVELTNLELASPAMRESIRIQGIELA